MKREDNHFQSRFEDFMNKVFPEACIHQREALRDAFFGGALIAYNRIMEATEQPEDEAIVHLDDIAGELERYSDFAGQRALTAMANTGSVN